MSSNGVDFSRSVEVLRVSASRRLCSSWLLRLASMTWYITAIVQRISSIQYYLRAYTCESRFKRRVDYFL